MSHRMSKFKTENTSVNQFGLNSRRSNSARPTGPPSLSSPRLETSSSRQSEVAKELDRRSDAVASFRLTNKVTNMSNPVGKRSMAQVPRPLMSESVYYEFGSCYLRTTTKAILLHLGYPPSPKGVAEKNLADVSN